MRELNDGEHTRGEQITMKKTLISLLVVALALFAATWTATPAQAAGWVYLGQSHVDGQHDHDNIKVGSAAARYRSLQIRVANRPIEFYPIVAPYRPVESQTLQVRAVLR